MGSQSSVSYDAYHTLEALSFSNPIEQDSTLIKTGYGWLG